MKIVDADAHANEDVLAWSALNAKRPGWIGAAQSGGRWVAEIEGKLFPVQEGPGCGVSIDASTNPAAASGAADVNQRLADMDAEGIDLQVLYGGLVIGVSTLNDAGLAADIAEAYNDWLVGELCAASPERLKGVAAVPIQDVGRAVAEMQRTAGRGAVAVTIPPVVGDLNLDDPSLLPFFEAAGDLGVAIGVHSAPGMNVPLPAAGRFSNYAQVHALSFPVDQMVAFTALAMGGVLDRFPGLRVAFLESGVGWVPYFLDRVGEHREKLAHLIPEMKSDPRDYLDRGQCFFSFEAEESLLALAVERLGSDAWIWASDYPHWDADFPGCTAEAKEMAGALGEDVAAKVLGANALRLYGLD